MKFLKLLFLPLLTLSTLVALYVPVSYGITIFDQFYLNKGNFLKYILGYVFGTAIFSYYTYALVLDDVQKKEEWGKIIAFSGVVVTSIKWMPIVYGAFQSQLGIDIPHSKREIESLILGLMYLVPLGILFDGLKNPTRSKIKIFDNLGQRDIYETMLKLAKKNIISRNLIEVYKSKTAVFGFLIISSLMGLSTYIGEILFNNAKIQFIMPYYIIANLLTFVVLSAIYLREQNHSSDEYNFSS